MVWICFLLSVDEGITGYRDDSLECVKRNQEVYGIPLMIVSYKELYGWTMDEIVREIGTRNNCTFCGVFRRQALDRGALKLGAARIVTGHNADDVAETVLMNLLRGDIARLARCVSITTGEDASEGAIPRCKPFMYAYQKEIVLYAYYKKLDYFSTECVYSPNAYRGNARDFLKDLESIRPSSILDIIHSAQTFRFKADNKQPTIGVCTRCGFMSSNTICKACVMLEGLNKGLPRIALSKEKNQRQFLQNNSNNNNAIRGCGGNNKCTNNCNNNNCTGNTCTCNNGNCGDNQTKDSNNNANIDNNETNVNIDTIKG